MENNIGIEEILKACEDNNDLKRIIMDMYAIAQKKIEEGKAGIYSENYQKLEDRYLKAISPDGMAEGKYFLEIGQDSQTYQRRAAIQYINNVIDANSLGVNFKSFDGKISFNAVKGFTGTDLEIERLFDQLIEKYVEVHPEAKEEIEKADYEFDGEINVTEETKEPHVDPEEITRTVADSEEVMETPVPEPTPVNNVSQRMHEQEQEPKNVGPESVVQYRNILKKEMDKISKKIKEINSVKPKNKEVSLNDTRFKELLKYNKRLEELKAEYDRTLEPDYESKYLKVFGVMNKPVSFLDDRIDAKNKKQQELEELLPKLKTSSAKGFTNLKIKIVKNMCKSLNKNRLVASSIQRGLVLPKGVVEIIKRKYIAGYEAKNDYYDAMVEDIESKLESLASNNTFSNKISYLVNEQRLKYYQFKADAMKELLDSQRNILLVTYIGSHTRALNKSVCAKKAQRACETIQEEEIDLDNRTR